MMISMKDLSCPSKDDVRDLCVITQRSQVIVIT